MPSSPKDKIIVALDTPSADQALTWVKSLKGRVGFFKVGLELFSACGPEIVRKIRAMDEQVFLDLKFYDIPNTVAAAVREATRLGAGLITLHAYGGPEMIQAALKARDETAKETGTAKPKLLGVTVLTSQAAAAPKLPGPLPAFNVEKMVLLMAKIAEREGLDGVIASAKEVESIRKNCSERFLIVTPGIRQAGGQVHDQKRVATPKEALAAGADYLVIGRPLTRAQDPSQALSHILQEMT